MSLLAAIDVSGNIQPNSIGHYDKDEWEIRFPNPLLVVEMFGEVPEAQINGTDPVSEQYIAVLHEGGPLYEFEIKPAVDRWHLELVGNDTITVLGNTNYTVKKVDADDNDILSGSEAVDIFVTRGLLSVVSVNLVSGQATFNLTAANETVNSIILVNVINQFFGVKAIKFVL